jgi:hypothetical protein
MKKGISRIPLEMARLKNEDMHENSSTAASTNDEFDFS